MRGEVGVVTGHSKFEKAVLKLSQSLYWGSSQILYCGEHILCVSLKNDKAFSIS